MFKCEGVVSEVLDYGVRFELENLIRCFQM